MKYAFCGIGGSGMSAIAGVLANQGHQVAGSDRSFDKGDGKDKQAQLVKSNIKIFPQDGSMITEFAPDVLVISTAVEETIPDVKSALENNVTIKKRSEILAEIFNSHQGIAIAGTSGKSTTTAMVHSILQEAGLSPTTINGAVLLQSDGVGKTVGLGNAVVGESDICVIEADESDGSIELYNPQIAVLNNVGLDHKSLEELNHLFGDFIQRAENGLGSVVNADCPLSLALKSHNSLLFGVESKQQVDLNATQLEHNADGVSYKLNNDLSVVLSVKGEYNVYNSLAAIGVAKLLKISDEDIQKGLLKFSGVKRRLEFIGEKNGVKVIDDFAHNGDKIRASLETLQREIKTSNVGRLIVMYQPHGFAPTKLLKNEYIEEFSNNLNDADYLLMPEIYFAGGTTTRDISSQDILDGVKKSSQSQGKNINTEYFSDRASTKPFLLKNARSGDYIVIMGARDDTLSDFAQNILENL